MDMRTRQGKELQPDTGVEAVPSLDQDIERCATYAELYELIDVVGDITIDTKDYVLNESTVVTYTADQTKKIIDEVRDGKRSIHDIPQPYRVKALSLLGSDREARAIKITT